jgi:BirA family biotin operon repressor/biotin-[acetyl-CoA-carboxylase] ligase
VTLRELRDGATAAGDAPARGFPARLERFGSVGSTNDVVAGWLRHGAPEICVAVADVQSAGRGRLGRSWTAPPGAALLASIGFRPTWLAPDRLWRLAAIVALSMADAAEDAAGLSDGTVRLKWPNDLVVGYGRAARPIGGAAVLGPGGDIRKLAGLLGETDGLGTPDVRAVVGIGLNADWPPEEFPAELARQMTSLREAAGGRRIDRDALLDGFLARRGARRAARPDGDIDGAGWAGRQVSTGRAIRLEWPDGSLETTRAIGVDATSGALVVDGEREVHAAEIRHVRLGAEV